MGRRGTRLALGVVAVALVVAGGAAVWWPRTKPAIMPTISVGTSGCGTGWTDPHPGEQVLWLSNTGTATAEVDLVEVTTGAVYGEIEGLPAGQTTSMRVVLGGGQFAVRCLVEGTDPITGPTVTLPGRPSDTGIVPVTANDLAGPLAAYQNYVRTGLDELVRDTDTLKAAVHAGNLANARSAWLPAHVAYQRLGGAYGAFGDLGDRIDGGPEGLAAGVADPDFTGFRRVEYGLWHGQGAAELAGSVDQLDTDVHALRDGFPGMQTAPGELGLRAHEILEDTLRQTLTGRDDQGSGTALATTAANLAGTAELVEVLRPLLATRYHGLSDVDRGLRQAGEVLAADRGQDGGYPPLDRLTTAQREQLNGAVGALVEYLAPIAVICEPRRTP